MELFTYFVYIPIIYIIYNLRINNNKINYKNYNSIN